MINVSSQERERSCICVLGHMCARTPSWSLSTTCPFDFGTVPTVWYILELFRQCGIFYNCYDSVVYFIFILSQHLPKSLQFKKNKKIKKMYNIEVYVTI